MPKVKCWKCKSIVVPVPIDEEGYTETPKPTMRVHRYFRQSERRIVFPGRRRNIRIYVSGSEAKAIGYCPKCGAHIVYE